MSDWRAELPSVRGRLMLDVDLAPYTWFRVGGPAEALFLPADEEDLSTLLRALPESVPVTVLGVGSNVIVRDGGIAGLVVRLAGKPFAQITALGEARLSAGAGALDAAVARAAAASGIAGLEFLAGVPGTIGGALTMNAGCYGSETRNVLVRARALDRRGAVHSFSVDELGYSYRSSSAPSGLIWLDAEFQGRPDQPDAVTARMADITARREKSQPIREKTGGSTFKNPDGASAWRLVDEAGWRGRPIGGARFSELHANFMINDGTATARDLETLGETVRTEVRARLGVDLEWEIKRIGRPGA